MFFSPKKEGVLWLLEEKADFLQLRISLAEPVVCSRLVRVNTGQVTWGYDFLPQMACHMSGIPSLDVLDNFESF